MIDDFSGRVAVVTGAASGIGYALAERAAALGMRLVMADIDGAALATAAATLGENTEVVTWVTDVSRADEVAALADVAYGTYGAVHLLCQNAGIATGGTSWEASEDDWRWVIDVDLWSVIHGHRAFIPRMLEQADPSHIVNTASMAGLMAGPGMGPYSVAKYGVVAASEVVRAELAAAGASVGISVLCPGFVSTDIGDSARHRQDRYPEHGSETETEEMARRREEVLAALAAGMDPAEVAGHVFGAVADGRFWILTHADFNSVVEQRTKEILGSA